MYSIGRLRMTNAELQSALMKQKTELQKTSGGSSGRRRYHHNHHHQHHTQQQQIKHSSTFSHFPPADRSTFSSEDASCELSISSKLPPPPPGPLQWSGQLVTLGPVFMFIVAVVIEELDNY